jgi:hypothetical protein
MKCLYKYTYTIGRRRKNNRLPGDTEREREWRRVSFACEM